MAPLGGQEHRDVHDLFNDCTIEAMAGRAEDFRPGSFSDVPLYNIQAVAAATGVPSITLRSWERRYGIPQPKRDVKGYRLYSDRDIAVARWLKERVEQGVGISRAVNMLQVLERGEMLEQPPASLDFNSLRERLLAAVVRFDGEAVNRVVGEALMVATVEETALEVMQPVLYDIGRLWAAGEISVTAEHVGSNLIRAQVTQLIRIAPAPLREETILVCAAPGELHDLGALMLALFLRRRGFKVVYAGANVEAESVARDTQTLAPSALCVSASTPQAAEAVRRLFESLHGEYGGILAFGGRIFNEDEAVTRSMPGVYLGQDAAIATRQLESLLSNRS